MACWLHAPALASIGLVRRLAASLAAGLMLALAGCASAPGQGRAPVQAADLVTESDESPQRKRARLRLELATAYYQQGMDAVALDEVKQALAIDARYPAALNLRGLVYLRLGQWRLAEESLAAALALAPSDADVAHNYGWLLCQQPQAASRQAESVALFQRALAQPGYTQAAKTWAAMGLCQQRMGQLQAAHASLRQAQNLESSPRTTLLLAQVLDAQGRWEEASAELATLHARQGGSAESLWLAVKVARKLDNQQLIRQLGEQLRMNFGQSPQAKAYDKGMFDE